jgi:hypothetical protein
VAIPKKPDHPSLSTAAPSIRLFFYCGITGFIFSCLYLLTMQRTIQGLDCGELATVAATGGIAHPPGYPLFTLLGNLFYKIIPWGTPCYKIGTVSAMAGAGTVSCLCFTAYLLSGSFFAGLFCACMLGLAPLFWHYSTVTDVFALHCFSLVFAIAIITWIIVNKNYAKRLFVLLGVACAMGISNHHTVILFFPIYCYLIVKLFSLPATVSFKIGRSLLSIIVACTGFLSYGLLIMQNGAWKWGHVSDLSSLFGLFIRADYGTFHYATNPEKIFWWENMVAFINVVSSQMHILIITVSLVGFFIWIFSCNKFRLLGFVLMGAGVISGPVFTLLFNISPVGLGGFVNERFYIAPFCIICLLAGLSLNSFADSAMFKPYRFLMKPGLFAILLVSIPGLFSHKQTTYLEDYVDNCMKFAKPKAVIIGNSDSELGGFLYMQQVLKKRPDIVFIAPHLLQASWYQCFLKKTDTTIQFPGYAVDIQNKNWLHNFHLVNKSHPLYISPSLWYDSLLLRRTGTVVPTNPALLEVLDEKDVNLDSISKELKKTRSMLKIRTYPENYKEAMATVDYIVYYNYAYTYSYLAYLFLKAGDIENKNKANVTSFFLSHPWQIPKENYLRQL